MKCLESILVRGISAGIILTASSSVFAEESEADSTNAPPRPPSLEPLDPAKLPVSRHVDFGVAPALVERITEGQTASGPTDFRYPAAIGVSVSARVDLWKYLRAGIYVIRSSTSSELAPKMLGLSGEPTTVPLASYALGLRLSPTMHWGPRARTWIGVGAGWGRMEMGRIDVSIGGAKYQIRERAFSFVEIPMSIGTSFDIIKNWLAVEFEATGAFHLAQRGTALRNGQTIDPDGHRTEVKPFPEITATFVQTIGLALVL